MKQTSNVRILCFMFFDQLSLGFLIIYFGQIEVGFVFVSWFIIVSSVFLTLEYMINWSHQNLLLSWLFFRALILFSKRSFKNSFQIKNLCLDQWLLHLEDLLKAITVLHQHPALLPLKYQRFLFTVHLPQPFVILMFFWGTNLQTIVHHLFDIISASLKQMLINRPTK